MEDTPMEGPPDMLVTRRPKRSTAGNRMEAALAEMALENAGKDLDDDNDFVNDKDEEDIFGSDFESTDEEAEKQAEEAGETEAVNEERRIKKAARSRLEKVTAAAHAKHRTTFNPDIQLSSTAANPKPKPKPKPRVSLGVIVDAETGEVVKMGAKDIPGKKRTSQRKHTVLNTSATVTRLKQSQAKKALQPKKAKAEYKRYTQGELIALALDTEEGNIVEHRDYLKNEAEKRKRARVVRTTVEGPLLRWISRKEEIKVAVAQPPPSALVVQPPPVASVYRSVYGPPGSLFTPTTYTYTAGNAVVSTIASTSAPQPQTSTSISTNSQPTTAFSHYQHYLDSTSSPFPMWPPLPPALQQTSYIPPGSASSLTTVVTPNSSQLPQNLPNTALSSQAAVPATQAQPPSIAEPLPTLEPKHRQETVTKNYVIHALAQQKAAPKPSWAESMQALFGDHVKWDEVKVYVGKGRPLSRPRQICPITGRQAHYLDPRSGVPYADSYAYKVLTELLGHEYAWSPSLGCYLNREAPPHSSVDEAKERARSGVRDDAMSVDED